MPRLSALARDLKPEGAFTVLARARALKAAGRDIIELEIGDSPFPSTPFAKQAGLRAIEENRTGYGPSLGLPELRQSAADTLRREFSVAVGAENIVVASGAKPFEQYFAEAFLEPDDGVLVFGPQFPTYLPNLQRRGARAVIVPLKAENQFRPRADDVRKFLESDPKPRHHLHAGRGGDLVLPEPRIGQRHPARVTQQRVEARGVDRGRVEDDLDIRPFAQDTQARLLHELHLAHLHHLTLAHLTHHSSNTSTQSHMRTSGLRTQYSWGPHLKI